MSLSSNRGRRESVTLDLMLTCGRLSILVLWTAFACLAADKSAVEKFAWMSGHWLGEENGAVSEEIWSAPSGNSMMGMWRLVSGGSVKVFELAALIEGERGVELFLKHFNGRMEPRASEKDHTSGMRLVGSADREMTFEGDEETGKVRLIYRRT